MEAAADSCIQALLELIETNVTYVVQEAIIVIKDIFRRYPGKYEGVIPVLCQHLDALDEPESKAAMVWIIGQFANRIDNADELLDDLLYTFLEESVEVSSLIRFIYLHQRSKHTSIGATCASDRSSQTLRLQASIRSTERSSPQGFKMGHRGS